MRMSGARAKAIHVHAERIDDATLGAKQGGGCIQGAASAKSDRRRKIPTLESVPAGYTHWIVNMPTTEYRTNHVDGTCRHAGKASAVKQNADAEQVQPVFPLSMVATSMLS